MSSLFDLVTSRQTLRQAFERASRNRASPGADGISLLEFSRDLDERLRALSDGLRAGTYLPHPAQQLALERPDGRTRRLVRLSVRDRLVHHAMAEVSSAHLDDALHPFAWAYRKGRSGKQALEQLDGRLRACKRAWVFRADIEDFFDHLAHALLTSSLEAASQDPQLVGLLEVLLGAGQFTGSAVVDDSTGAPQGSALSPFLANLALASLDQAVEQAGYWMVRYGDDLCIPVDSCWEALRAEATVRQSLTRLGLSLAENKVIVASLREGFDFLGFRLDSRGLRPGDRARQRLVEKLHQLEASGRPDTGEEQSALLRGWLAYYGPFDLSSLPEHARARAEALEAGWAQKRQEEALGEEAVHAPEEPASAPSTAMETGGDDAEPDSWSPERLEAERLAREGKFDEAARVEPPPVASPEPAAARAPRRSLPLVPGLAASPRAQQLCAGCAVLRALVEQAAEGQGLVASERFLVADLLGRLGDEAERAVDGVFRHLMDHKPGMTRRYLGKLFPMPTSCARIRQRLPELAERVGCDCRFRLEGGVYPTPLLHVLGAAEIPGLEERAGKAAVRLTRTRAIEAAVNQGHKELGDRAAALCARLVELRRQERWVEQEKRKVEAQLEALLREAGEAELETPSGVLCCTRNERGLPEFLLKV